MRGLRQPPGMVIRHGVHLRLAGQVADVVRMLPLGDFPQEVIANPLGGIAFCEMAVAGLYHPSAVVVVLHDEVVARDAAVSQACRDAASLQPLRSSESLRAVVVRRRRGSVVQTGGKTVMPYEAVVVIEGGSDQCVTGQRHPRDGVAIVAVVGIAAACRYSGVAQGLCRVA